VITMSYILIIYFVSFGGIMYGPKLGAVPQFYALLFYRLCVLHAGSGPGAT